MGHGKRLPAHDQSPHDMDLWPNWDNPSETVDEEKTNEIVWFSYYMSKIVYKLCNSFYHDNGTVSALPILGAFLLTIR